MTDQPNSCKRRWLRPLLPSCLLLLGAIGLASGEKPIKTEAAAAEPKKVGWIEPVKQEIEGWTVNVDPQLLEGGEFKEEGDKALKMLANHFQRIEILVKEEQLKELKKVEFWLEHSHPELGGMQYHPGKDWLVDRGYDPRLTKKVHITQAKNLFIREQLLKHPAVVLHELAHAYHDQVLSFEDAGILKAYRMAMAKGSLEKVMLYDGRTVRHYAASNHKEYFAEMTEAFLYRNDFYPFVYGELKEFDPRGFAEMERVWGKGR